MEHSSVEQCQTSRKGYNKVLLLGCLFSRFVWAIPLKDEKAETVAEAILNEWILRFGPPERLLSDRAKIFMSEMVTALCEKVGARKIFTSPYHPQTDGFVERFNRTLLRDVRAFIRNNPLDWDSYIAMACFRYNTSRNEATGMTTYMALFGIEAFDFDATVARHLIIDQESGSHEELQEKLAEVHRNLLSKGLGSRMNAATQYKKLVEEMEFKIGDRVMVYNPRYNMQTGRKLSTPWMGPYRIEEVLTSISYLVRAEIGNEVGGAHVNRLRAFEDQLQETGNVTDGVFRDTRRIIQRIVANRTVLGNREFKVRHVYKRGWSWIPEAELRSLIVREYDWVQKIATQQ